MDDLNELLEKNLAKVKIREMWVIECPNHGDAGILNEKVLKWGYDPTCKPYLPYTISFVSYLLQLQFPGKNTPELSICSCQDMGQVSMLTSLRVSWWVLDTLWVQCACTWFSYSVSFCADNVYF
jgi:hypothetical protein